MFAGRQSDEALDAPCCGRLSDRVPILPDSYQSSRRVRQRTARLPLSAAIRANPHDQGTLSWNLKHSALVTSYVCPFVEVNPLFLPSSSYFPEKDKFYKRAETKYRCKKSKIFIHRQIFTVWKKA